MRSVRFGVAVGLGLLTVSLAAACGDDVVDLPDESADSGTDASIGKPDSGRDAATDASPLHDAGHDAASTEDASSEDASTSEDADAPDADLVDASDAASCQPSACPGVDDECQTRTCTEGVCGVDFRAAGTALAAQTAGDCKRLQCDGAGHSSSVDDDADAPASTECVEKTCVNGQATSAFPEGTVCATGLCDGNGTCVQCIAATDCPGQDTECQVRTCSQAMCGFAFTASGTPVAAQSAGDCRSNQCDGNGQVASNQANDDLPNDGNPCTSDICNAGVPSTVPLAQGSVCSQDGMVCNGAGSCVGCLNASTCPGQDSECQARTCTGGTCGFSFTVAGTPVATQTAGDCVQNQCNGAGGVTSGPSPADVPQDEGNQCTSESCIANVPSHPAKATGAACSQNGGTVCFDAQCMQCNVSADCPAGAPVCSNHFCLAN